MVNAPDATTPNTVEAPKAVPQSPASSNGTEGQQHLVENMGKLDVKEHQTNGVEGDGVDKEAGKPTNMPPPDVAATIPCRFFAVGQCKYGDECAFSHKVPKGGYPPEVLQQQQPPPSHQQQQPQQPQLGLYLPPGSTPSTQQQPVPMSPTHAASPNGGIANGMPLPPVPQGTAVDFNGYPVPTMPPHPYYFYGMPQPAFYGPPMHYGQPPYVDGQMNGVYGVPYPPFSDFSGPPSSVPTPPQAPRSSPSPSVSSAGRGPRVSPAASETTSTSAEYVPRTAEVHPAASEMMQSPVMPATLPMSPPMPQLPMHPGVMMPPVQPMPAMPPQPMQGGGHERRLSNQSFQGAPPSRGGGLGRSHAPSSRRNTGYSGAENGHTASAIVSIPRNQDASGGSSTTTSQQRAFPAHGRYATEPGTPRSSMNGEGGRPRRDWPCAFFPENRCKNGDECTYTHILPDGTDARTLQKGMIGIDGRTEGPAESSRTFVFPGGPRGGRGGGYGGRGGGGRGGGLSRSYGPRVGMQSDEVNGYHHHHPHAHHHQGSGGEDGGRRGRWVDDEAREKVEQFIQSNRASSAPTRPSHHHHHQVNGVANGEVNGFNGQRIPSVGDFPALAAEAHPVSTSASAPLSPRADTVKTSAEEESTSPTALKTSFASAAARGAKATSAPLSPAVEPVTIVA